MPDAIPRNCFIDSLIRRAVECDRKRKYDLSKALLEVAWLGLKGQFLNVGDRLIGIDTSTETFIGYRDGED